jgi:hypothetical protein
MRRWIEPGGSDLLAISLLLACAHAATAETAILECVADAVTSGASVAAHGREMKLPGSIFVSFRTWNVTRWRVDNATILLHVARGEAPATVDIAVIAQPWGEIEPPRGDDPAKMKFTTLKVTPEPEGWVSLQVPGKLVEDIAANRAHGLALRFKPAKELVIHSRESGSFSPYLIVMGAQR